MDINKNIFDPSLLSFPDCDYLLAHAGEQPAIALQSMPPTVNRYTMKQWIERLYELGELEKAGYSKWAGVQAVKDAIKLYLTEREKWALDATVGAPKLPSLYAFDSRGNGHLGAPGSDSERVKSYFDEEGNRKQFALNLTDSSATGAWKPKWARDTKDSESPGIIEPKDKNAIECGVKGCGHTETFKPESRSSYSVARARLSKHMRKAQFEPEQHLEMYTLTFKSGSIK